MPKQSQMDTPWANLHTFVSSSIEDPLPRRDEQFQFCPLHAFGDKKNLVNTFHLVEAARKSWTVHCGESSKIFRFFSYHVSLHILVVNALFFATLHSCFKGKSYRNASNVVQLHMSHFSLSIRHTSTSIPLSIAWPRFISFKPFSWCYLSIFKYFISIVTQLSLLISVRGYRLLPTVSHFYVNINHVVTRLSLQH